MEVKSAMPLDQWIGNLTAFSSFYDVFPVYVIERGGWDEIGNYVAGDVAIGPNKDLLPFIVPCSLKDAPMTAHGKQRTGLEVGKQRSSAHMTEATWLVMDIDGLDYESFVSKIKVLIATGCAFRVYSTC
jgi:hypothetical protein